MTAPPIRVLVVDDHAVVRDGLCMILGAADDIDVVGTAGDGAQAIAAAASHPPDVVLMDLAMPVMDGVAATSALRTAHPAVKIVVLTSMGEQATIVRALDAGADGYLFKHAEPEEILRGIREAHGGGAVLDPKAARALLDAGRDRQSTREMLSHRETQVLQLVREGLANKQIARRLGITERTVKAHLTKIYSRLGVTDRTQAALWAAEHLP